MSPRGRTAVVLGLLAVLVASVACTGGEAAPPPTTAAGGRRATTGAVPAAYGPLTADLAPSAAPAQAGEVLQRRAVPTNQWWTSALVGPFTQNLWARPLVARATASGFEVGVPDPATVTATSIATAVRPALVLGGALTGVEVTGYDDFSVQLGLRRRAGGALTVELAQGSPILYVSVPAGEFEMSVAGALGASPARPGPGRLTLTIGGRLWDVATTAPADWRISGATIRSKSAAPMLLAIAPRPDGADERWSAAFADAASRPLRATSSTLAVDWTRGVVRQTLHWDRADDRAAPVALLPHQVTPGGQRPLGTFASAIGPLTVVSARDVTVEYPLPGLLAGVPALSFEPADRDALVADLRLDLAATAIDGGSYGSAKALGRVAMLAELARAVGATTELQLLVESLRAGLRDWYVYDGPDDPRWLAYDPTWGGVVAHPSEYGNRDYNDHHFQYGYLIRAAATLVELSPGDLGEVRAMTDLLVHDVMGGGADLPPFRVFNAYEGHSFASGFAPGADGNDQESSSEAVHAWEAIARWGLASGDADTADGGIARYAVEAATARAYWLGELDGVRAAGYPHDVAGIVWGGKVDFATWFDARASAAIGIQLLPITFGSLYRTDADAARARAASARAADGDAMLWPDIFAMDEAITDPTKVASAPGTITAVEVGSSRTLLRYWVLALGRLGAPTTDGSHATSPDGLAFAHAFVARNPTNAPRQVAFVDARGAPLATVTVAPGATVVQAR